MSKSNRYTPEIILKQILKAVCNNIIQLTPPTSPDRNWIKIIAENITPNLRHFTALSEFKLLIIRQNDIHSAGTVSFIRRFGTDYLSDHLVENCENSSVVTQILNSVTKIKTPLNSNESSSS